MLYPVPTNFKALREELQSKAAIGVWIPASLRVKYDITLKQDQEESLLQRIGDSLPKWMGGDG